MRYVIDTRRVHLSPAERLTLTNIMSRMPCPCRPVSVAVQAVDEVLGEKPSLDVAPWRPKRH